MRILWLSSNKGLSMGKGGTTSYNGGGWITSLEKLFVDDANNKLGFAYLTANADDKAYEYGNISHFPVYSPAKSRWAKIKQYYGGYKHDDSERYLPRVKQIVEEFKPDVVHLFGLENPLAKALGEMNVTKVVHLQGFLSPCQNAFMPPGFNEKTFIWPITSREWVLRNGYIFAKKSMRVRGEWEIELFKKFDQFLGRTEWDYRVSQLLSPRSSYYYVSEVLRDGFYKNAGQWKYDGNRQFTIISTISNTIYKGLDLVIKTASLLKRTTTIDFRWQVVGIKPSDGIVRMFEKELGISGCEVGVEYLGVKSAEELCELLLQSSAYVHPSYIDNSPNSLCEAQMLGMPVVGCYVGGVPSLIENGETGYLVPANAPFELAYLLGEMSANGKLCQQLGNNAFAAASQRHNRETIKRDLLNAYVKVCVAFEKTLIGKDNS